MAKTDASDVPGPTGTLAYGARPHHAPIGLAHTLADEPSAPGSGRSSAMPRVEGSVRSTVLPRVEHVEGARRVVLSGRPRYEDLEHLGTGGQGHVVLARDHDIDRKVAVKRIRTEGADEGAMLRFAEEVRVVGRIEHPNVVPIHDVGIDQSGNYYYVMKHVEGETLEAVIAHLRAGDPAYVTRYTPEYRIQICYEILRGIEHAHSLGILHRDLKPANLMIGSRGEVVVMDWGLAKTMGAPEASRDAAPASSADPRARLFETQAGAVLGTPAYMSPEQAAGGFDALDARSDVYSLAVVFYEFFCLQHPRRQCESMAEMIASVVSEPIDKARVFGDFGAARAPALLAHFVRHGLAQAPGARYPSVTAMRARLELIRDGKAPIECQLTLAQGTLRAVSRGIDRHPRASSLLLLALGAGCLGGIARLLWMLVR